MKKITLFGLLGAIVAIVIAVFAAFDQGQRSPVYVEGSVSLASEYQSLAKNYDTVFFIIFDENSPMPMPYGAVKERVADLFQNGDEKVELFITYEKLRVMNPNRPRPESMRVKVRFDRDGVAGADQPGDIVGELTGVAFGSRGVSIVADRMVN